MKALFALASLSLLPLGYLANDWANHSCRFELVKSVEPNWQAKPEEATFRIDRRTGKVWVLQASPVQVADGIAQTQAWHLVSEETDANHIALMRTLDAR